MTARPRPTLPILILLLALAGNEAAMAQARVIAVVTDARGAPVADAVVVAMPLDGPPRLPARPREATILQVGKEFVPRVSVVTAGTAVSFPNNDDVRHHVYSFSPAKRFELPLYLGTPSQPVVFDRPGVVVLGCNIHDWMIAYVYVSESPHFALTAANGQAVMDELAPREHAVRIWHPLLEGDEAETRRVVDLGRTRSVELRWTVALKPEVRVRRAPSSLRGSHY